MSVVTAAGQQDSPAPPRHSSGLFVYTVGRWLTRRPLYILGPWGRVGQGRAGQKRGVGRDGEGGGGGGRLGVISC